MAKMDSIYNSMDKFLEMHSLPWLHQKEIYNMNTPVSKSLLKLMSIESEMLSSNLVLCHPLLLLASVFPSIRVFSKGPAFHKWPKYWSFSFTISNSNEYLGLISFRIDWFNLALQTKGLSKVFSSTSSKASVLWCSAFSMVLLSSTYLTTGKTIALTIWSFVSKVRALLFKLCLGLAVTRSYQTLCNPWTVASQAPLSLECSRQ